MCSWRRCGEEELLAILLFEVSPLSDCDSCLCMRVCRITQPVMVRVYLLDAWRWGPVFDHKPFVAERVGDNVHGCVGKRTILEPGPVYTYDPIIYVDIESMLQLV